MQLGTKKRLAAFGLALVMLLTVAGRQVAEAAAYGSTMEKGAKVLVLPFTCDILPEGSADTTDMLSKMISAQIVYNLQKVGMVADVYNEQTVNRPVRNPYMVTSNTGPAPSIPVSTTEAKPVEAETMQPLVPYAKPTPTNGDDTLRSYSGKGRDNKGEAATNFIEVTDANTEIVAANSGRSYGKRNVQAPTIKSGSGSKAQLASVAKSVDLSPQAVQNHVAEGGYNYILSGTITHIETKLGGPARLGGADRITVRIDFGSTYQLFTADGGKVTSAGAIEANDAKMYTIRGAVNNSTLTYPVERVLRNALTAAAEKIMCDVTGIDPAEFSADKAIEEERSYYQDSPGKMLKPKRQ